VTIAETAAAVSRALGENTPVTIARKPQPGQPAQRYVPDVSRASRELQLDQWTQLDDAIRATARWHRLGSSA
jgi:nucleoside-diphosphate-sugar epimerase